LNRHYHLRDARRIFVKPIHAKHREEGLLWLTQHPTSKLPKAVT